MARRDDEDSARGRHAAHVSNASHARGGGHTTVSRAARITQTGLIRRAARQPGDPVPRLTIDPFDPGVLIEEDDDMSHPLYQGMKFKDYEYHEFPKFIPIEGHPGGGKVVENEDEEATVLSGAKLLREPEERARLIAIVDVKNIPNVDRRWNVEKIRKAIVDTGFDPKLDPSK